MNAKEFLAQVAQKCEEHSISESFVHDLDKATNSGAELSKEQRIVLLNAINSTLIPVEKRKIDSSHLPLEVLRIATYINSCK